MDIKSLPLMTLVLAVIYGIAGLLILIISIWFIAACALAPPLFNYMLPAVAIRGLALLRIASGYGHLWLGHDDLLTRAAANRLALFERLKDKTIARRANGTEVLATHTEALASVWVGWVSHQATAVTLLGITIVCAYFWHLIGLTAVAVFSGFWLLITLGLIGLGLRFAQAKISTEQSFRFESEHFFNTSSIWHLYPDEQKPHGNLSAAELWRQQARHDNLGHWAAIVLQGIAYSLCIVVITQAPSAVLQQPLMLIVPMVLLAAPDWLGRSLAAFPALSQAKSSQGEIQNVPLNPTSPICVAPLTQGIELRRFSATDRLAPTLDITLPTTGLVLLRGESGCGKSSLLQALAGCISHSGDKIIDGKNTQTGLIQNWTYVEQTPLLLSAKVKDNLFPHGHYKNDKATLAVLNQLGLAQSLALDEWIGAEARQLSGGEKKRLVLARALLNEPDVLLLDEPLEGLDQELQTRVMEVIKQVSECHLVVMASHIQHNDFDDTLTINLTAEDSDPEESVERSYQVS